MIIPYDPAHFESLKLQDAQWMFAPLLDDYEYAVQLDEQGHAFSLVIDGQCLACVGAVNPWDDPGRATGWGLMGGDCGDHFPAIHRATKRWIEAWNLRRLEITVNEEFCQAQRWATMLGFQKESVMKAYYKTGGDAGLWVRMATQ